MGRLNINWHYREFGDPTGTPMVLLHGFMAHGRIWLPTMKQLPSGINSIAPDLPGHGGTSVDMEYLDIELLSEALAEFISQHFDKPVIMTGYSMGGRIALFTALRNPDLISALILESSTAGIEAETERSQRIEQDQKRADKLRRLGIKAYLNEWYQQPLFASLKRHPGMVESIIEKKLDNDPNHLAEVVVRLSPGNQPSLWGHLAEWKKPTLIVCGELDTKFCEIGRRMAGLLPDGQLKIIGDAGHIVHLENNKDFVAALNFFLATYIL